MDARTRRSIFQSLLLILVGYLAGNYSPRSVSKIASKVVVSRLLQEDGSSGRWENEEGSEHEEQHNHGHEYENGHEHRGHHEGGEEEEEEEEERGFDLSSDEDVTVVVCIVLLLITLTIAFEYTKETLEERANRNLRPIVDKLFGELTVLGFLSMFTFIVTKAGYFSILSEMFFGDEEELLEIFEFVHFTIFFIMVTFVAQVLILVSEAMGTEEDWTQMDRMARDPSLANEWERRAEKYYDRTVTQRRKSFASVRELSNLLPFMRDRRAQRREDLLMFKALRREFVLERSPHPPFSPAPESQRVSPDFNFGRYLGVCMGNLLAQVVEVSVVTWMIFALLTCVYYFYVILVNESVEILAWSWVVFGWVVFFYNIMFERHLLQVRSSFLQKEIFLLGKVDNKSISGLSPHELTYLKEVERNAEDPNRELPMWTKVDIDDYCKKRSWITRMLVPGVPNRQQSLYWMDRKGPKFYMLILQSNLLFLGIYSAMNVLGFLQFMVKEPIHIFIVYVILASLPLFGVMFFKQHLVAVLSQVCCMGAYRRPNVVADVLREEKTSRVVRAFIVIYKMRRFAEKANSAKSISHTKPKKIFDKVELTEVGKTFDSFDTSGDGAISYEEFESLMTNLGAEMTPESLNRMISMLDENGDGDVSKEEFVSWYAENALDDDLSESERAKYLFGLFDVNGNGELTIGEFKRTLDALNVGFSVDEVGAIVQELDEDNSGTIGLDEFSHLLHKYYPKELQQHGHGHGGHGHGHVRRISDDGDTGIANLIF